MALNASSAGVVRGRGGRADAHGGGGGLHPDGPAQPVRPVRAAAGGGPGRGRLLRLRVHRQLRPAPDPPQAARLHPLHGSDATRDLVVVVVVVVVQSSEPCE